MIKGGFALLFVLFWAALPARADVPEGEVAYRAGDYQAALELFRPLAEQGDSEAQYWMGRLADAGHGMPSDSDAALRWFQSAAGQGAIFAFEESSS